VRIVCCWNLSPSEVEKKIAEEFGSSGEGGPEAKLHDESSEKIVQYLDGEASWAEPRFYLASSRKRIKRILQCLSPDSLLLHGVRLLLQHRGPLL
jgi:hypothetical protein